MSWWWNTVGLDQRRKISTCFCLLFLVPCVMRLVGSISAPNVNSNPCCQKPCAQHHHLIMDTLIITLWSIKPASNLCLPNYSTSFDHSHMCWFSSWIKQRQQPLPPKSIMMIMDLDSADESFNIVWCLVKRNCQRSCHYYILISSV